MRTKLGMKAVSERETDLLIVGLFQDEQQKFGFKQLGVKEIAADRHLTRHIEARKFTGSNGSLLTHFYGGFARDVMLLGLGPRESFNLEALRSAATAAFRKTRELGATEVTFAPISLDGTAVTPEQLGETLAAYAGLIDYRLNHQKDAKLRFKDAVRIETLRLQNSASFEYPDRVERALEDGLNIAASVNLARDLSNEPAADCTPQRMAAEAKRIADDSDGNIKCRVYGKKALKAMGANAILAVNFSSPLPPALIHLHYKPRKTTTDKVLVLVGKSVTFDTGGLDLKPAAGMRTMKRDMSGGAATMAAIEAIAKLGLPIEVHAVMAATENGIGPKAYKPGDVIHTFGGISIEVDNTDAEGRLTLVDAITFAKLNLKPDYIVDIATLTGAVKSIGGDVAAGAFSNDDALLAAVDAAATAGGEQIQPMRMFADLRTFNDTPIADVKNSGGEFAGSTTAAWFIREYVDRGTSVPWVHLDIAGTAYRARELGADPAGATGWGVRTLIELARGMSASSKK